MVPHMGATAPHAWPRVLVMGASGRLGTALRAVWPGCAVAAQWQFRGAAPRGALAWNPLRQPVPDCGPLDAVLCLSGVTAGPDLARNTDLALAALGAARATGAGRVLLASSAAVYGAAPGPHAEDGPCHPASDYGHAKLAMERVALDAADGLAVTCLRIGNVAGADALLGGLIDGQTPQIDRFADGRGPRRAYIGPATLARALAHLVGRRDLPDRLNLAQPGLVAMADLLRAAGRDWHWRDAPPCAVPVVALDLGRLDALCPLPVADPATLVAEWHAP